MWGILGQVRCAPFEVDEVSQHGNKLLTWKGADPWKSTSDDELQYAWQLDGGEWSPFTSETHQTLLTLPSGDHIFAVKARDRDFNEDPIPAIVHFTVLPPVWKQPWFIGLMAAMLGGIGYQTGRVVRRDRRLKETNTALSAANRDLFGLNQNLQQKTEDLETANQELQRDRAVERIRAQVQTMEKASDFDGVLSVLAEDLRGVGLNFDTCEIDVLDASDDETAMAYFEARGFNYTTYMLDPDGHVTEESYQVQSPFPNVTREMIERFIAGEPWRAVIGEGN
ncbi:MAG: hypothetical protein O7G87_11355, partial [bacterium]|nr:hypothetical protein [bacterium]